METTNIINEGFTLLVLGMGFVFLFLALLVIAMNIMSSLVQRFSAPEVPAVVNTSAISNTSAQINPDVIAAIRAAIAQHREKNN